jgi:outer membrane protein
MKKMSKNLLLALALSFGTVSYSQAQQEPKDGVWSLHDAINYAVKHNLQVRQRQVNAQTSQINANQSKFDLLPAVNGSASHVYNYGSSVDPLTSEFRTQEIRSNNLSVSANVPIFQGFQLQNRIKQNRLNLEADQMDVESSQNDVTLQVLTSYLNILFADELLKTAELQRNSTLQQLDRTRILFKAGSVAETNVLELQAQLATDDLAMINAQNQREISRLGLMQQLNLQNPDRFEILIPEIPEPDAEPVAINTRQVYDVAVQTLPQVRSAELRVRSAEKGFDFAKGAYYPRLSFNTGIFTGYSSARLSPTTTTIEGEFDRQTIGFLDPNGNNPLTVWFPKSTRGEYSFNEQINDNLGKSVGFSLGVPIFNGLQVRNNVQRAKLAQHAAQLNADIAKNQIRQTIEQASTDAIAAQRRYVAAKQQVASLEQSFRNAELRLNSGVINSVEFNVIANNFRRAQSDLIQAKYDYTFKLKVLDFYQGKDISF